MKPEDAPQNVDECSGIDSAYPIALDDPILEPLRILARLLGRQAAREALAQRNLPDRE